MTVLEEFDGVRLVIENDDAALITPSWEFRQGWGDGEVCEFTAGKPNGAILFSWRDPELEISEPIDALLVGIGKFLEQCEIAYNPKK